MKKYSQLTTKEKDLFLAYITTKTYMTNGTPFLLLSVFVFIALSSILVVLGSIPSLVAAFFLLLYATAITFMLFYTNDRTNKITRIIFDVEDFPKEFFGIDKSDLLNMKKTYTSPLEEKKDGKTSRK